MKSFRCSSVVVWDLRCATNDVRGARVSAKFLQEIKSRAWREVEIFSSPFFLIPKKLSRGNFNKLLFILLLLFMEKDKSFIVSFSLSQLLWKERYFPLFGFFRLFSHILQQSKGWNWGKVEKFWLKIPDRGILDFSFLFLFLRALSTRHYHIVLRWERDFTFDSWVLKWLNFVVVLDFVRRVRIRNSAILFAFSRHCFSIWINFNLFSQQTERMEKFCVQFAEANNFFGFFIR